MSGSNCCFLTCIQISQEAGKVVWYLRLLKNIPQFVLIYCVSKWRYSIESGTEEFKVQGVLQARDIYLRVSLVRMHEVTKVVRLVGKRIDPRAEPWGIRQGQQIGKIRKNWPRGQ